MIRDWSRIFAATGFRWRMGLRAGDVHSFFAPTPERSEILAERCRCLDESAADYAALIDSGQPLLDELRQFAAVGDEITLPSGDSLETLGRCLEPDFVLLLPSPGGPLVVGGVVCFPSSWALPEKIGRTLHETHKVVPELNSKLGERIRITLDRLQLGAAWERENWGLSRDCERNHHPHKGWRRFDESVEPQEIWLRLERQIVYRLPQTGGILFGIRLEITPWHEFIQYESARTGLRYALETMPDPIASYKGVLSARSSILRWLAD